MLPRFGPWTVFSQAELPALPTLTLAAVAALYLWGVLRLTGRGDRWSIWRTVAFLIGGVGTLAIALLSSAVPFTLEMMALRMLPARTFGILMSMEPAVAALCGLMFLHEKLTTTQWLALLFVSIASAGTTLTARDPSPAVEA